MKLPLNRQRIGAVFIALIILTGGVAGFTPLFTVGSGASYEAPSGLVVETAVDHDLDGSNPIVDNQTISVQNVTFSADANASLTVDQFSGSYTNISSVDASQTEIKTRSGRQAISHRPKRHEFVVLG